VAFTFNANLSDSISKVRQLIGDVVDAGHLIEDATITAYLTEKTTLGTAAQLARDLASRFAGAVDTAVDGAQFRNSQRYRAFNDLALKLEGRLASEAAGSTDSGAFTGLGVFGATSQEVIDARCDPDAATNAPLVSSRLPGFLWPGSWR
jgi:hypothetical protein